MSASQLVDLDMASKVILSQNGEAGPLTVQLNKFSSNSNLDKFKDKGNARKFQKLIDIHQSCPHIPSLAGERNALSTSLPHHTFGHGKPLQ